MLKYSSAAEEPLSTGWAATEKLFAKNGANSARFLCEMCDTTGMCVESMSFALGRGCVASKDILGILFAVWGAGCFGASTVLLLTAKLEDSTSS